MTIAPISSTAPPPQLIEAAPPGRPGSAGAMFAGMLDHYMAWVGQQRAQSEHAIQELALGHTENLHNVILEITKADQAFRTFMEVRNKLSDAYQEIMRMQV